MQIRWWCWLCCLLSSPAFAWGDPGHQVIALVADRYLAPRVRLQVNALLATDASGLTSSSLADQATWADKYRDSDRNTTRRRYEQTREWHYVNIQLADGNIARPCFAHPALPAGTPASGGPGHACIIDKIEQFAAELGNPDTPRSERLLALQFLLHFVGDVHQPLHASDDQDRGGNDKPIRLPGFDPNNLHQFWDNEAVRRLGNRPATVARELTRGIRPSQRKAWSRGTPADWARETFVVAKTHSYARLPASDLDGRRTLTPAYVTDATQVAKLQLRKAGVRLAAVLNAALR